MVLVVDNHNEDCHYMTQKSEFGVVECDLQIINEELAKYINSLSWNSPTFYDNDDDDEYSIQHYSKNESDEVINSSVEDHVPIPSVSEGILENMCNVPFSDKNHFDAESGLIKSLLTRDTSIVYSPKIDSLLEEFAGELVHIDQIPPGIDETDSDSKDDIRFIKKLSYYDTLSEDDSFEDIDYVEALPPDSELVSLEESPSLSFLSYTDNSSPKFKTFSYHTKETSSGSTTTHANNTLPEYDSFLFEIEPDQGELTNDIPDNSKNDPLMEVVDLYLALKNSIPLGIENIDYDSEGDILFLEEFLRDDSLPLLEFESFHFYLYDDPSSPRPSKKPPDDGGILTTKVVDDISYNSTRELYVHVLNVLPSPPTLCPNIDTLLLFSSENEDKVFNPGILSSPLLSHQGKITFDFTKSPMTISEGDIPFLDVLFLHFYLP
nr:hypothetical protein [Tanacetum cinerariifolium]